MALREVFQGKTVLVTGHTGFKGSWLSLWLNSLGANVHGYALGPPSTPSHFVELAGNDFVSSTIADITDRERFVSYVVDLQPDFIFHLAAQPIVKLSHDDPMMTWQTNLMGTVHLLEALRVLEKRCNVVFITSDKAYDNVEWVWGYRENDSLGGPDPYSASKGAAEIAIKSYFRSYFDKPNCSIRLASARAGNVIGGGDWADSRIVPDCMRAWATGEKVTLRNPQSTRPWQHVLEPLSGYIALAMDLAASERLSGEAFNFGPAMQHSCTVEELVQRMSVHWDMVRWTSIEMQAQFYESKLLKLNSDKAAFYLKWEATLGLADTIKMTVDWYRRFYEGTASAQSISRGQIDEFCEVAAKKGLEWSS